MSDAENVARVIKAVLSSARQIANKYKDGIDEMTIDCPCCDGVDTLRFTDIQGTPAAACSNCRAFESE